LSQLLGIHFSANFNSTEKAAKQAELLLSKAQVTKEVALEGMDVSEDEAALVDQVLRDNPTPTTSFRRIKRPSPDQTTGFESM
jgi:hypothetical protein